MSEQQFIVNGMVASGFKVPDLETVQIHPEFLDRWITIGEGNDQLQGFKFEKFGPYYVMIAMFPDGTGQPIAWPEDATTFLEASRAVQERERDERSDD